MTLKECLLINNKCYKANQRVEKEGIVVHDTGAGNPYLKRYVQPLPQQTCYQEMLSDLGINRVGNHWNGTIWTTNKRGEPVERFACVGAFIGLNAYDEIETVRTLPDDMVNWGVGEGRYGSYNRPPHARIQFEICDDGYVSESYFNRAMKEAQEYCAYLCIKYGWNSDRICCHYEAYQQGYGGNHNDITVWLKTFGKNMNWFRAEVQKLIDKKGDDSPMTEAEKKRFAELEEKVKTLETGREKVYHYYDELPAYARPVIEKLHKNGVFKGAGPDDMALPESLMRMLLILVSAGVLKV